MLPQKLLPLKCLVQMLQCLVWTLHLTTEEMQERIVGVLNPFQSDVVEGYLKSEFYHGQVYLLITSSWCPLSQTQTPVLITVIFDKESDSFAIHFWHLFYFFGKHEDIKNEHDFVQLFPGNTSDFSNALQNQFFDALD